MVVRTQKDKSFMGHKFGPNQRLVGRYENCTFFMANLSSARLLGTFVDCNFQLAELNKTHFIAATFIRCDFSVSYLEGVYMRSTEFDGCDFSNSTFQGVDGLVSCTFKINCVGMDSIKGAKALPSKNGVFKVFNSTPYLETTSNQPPKDSYDQKSMAVRIDSNWSLASPDPTKSIITPTRWPKKRTPKKKDTEFSTEVNKLPTVEHYRSSPHREKKIVLSNEEMMARAYAAAYSQYDDWSEYHDDVDADWGFGNNAVLQCSSINIFRGIRTGVT